MFFLKAFFFIFLLLPLITDAKEPEAKLEHSLDYPIDYPALEKGNFQYYYALLKESKQKQFENLFEEQSRTPVEELLKTFLPLDTKKLWDPADGNFLAIAKITHILPVPLSRVSEEKFTSIEYLQSTLPRYKVTKRGESFHVGGSLITPDFDVSVTFLGPEHPYVGILPLIDKKKLQDGSMKASFMHQENFGKVLFFRTAKSSSALILYEESGARRTLVTQYIFSNVINVPTKDLIRKGMIENLRDVVRESRAAVTR